MAREYTLAQGLASIKALIREDFTLNLQWSERASVAVLRCSTQLYRTSGPVAWALRRVMSVVHNVWLVGVMGADIPTMVQIGPRLRLPHAGRGVVLHCGTVIGSDATIYHRVTVGARGGYRAPRIGNNVYLGVGCAVLGDIEVADGTSVGANAVLLESTESDTTYVGQAARAVVRGRGRVQASREPAPHDGRKVADLQRATSERVSSAS